MLLLSKRLKQYDNINKKIKIGSIKIICPKKIFKVLPLVILKDFTKFMFSSSKATAGKTNSKREHRANINNSTKKT